MAMTLDRWSEADAVAHAEAMALTDRIRELLGNQTTREVGAALGLSAASVVRWRKRRDDFDAGKLASLAPGKSDGRPALTNLNEVERAALREAYLKTNLNRKSGSMTLAARYLARDPDSPLSDSTRRHILKDRASKHSLPAEIRRACRATEAAVATYRDDVEAKLKGISASGTMRMTRTDDGELRRLLPGERWSVDDASVNFCVVVPWPWGGDKCSDRYGVRVGRFQLLMAIDDATHCGIGWNYTIRMRDSYRADDVVAMLAGTMRHAYAPERIMLEGGAWQAGRTLEFCRLAGVVAEDAKGRPNQKLVENWFNDFWTILSVKTAGQIGRYRGEMAKENDLWQAARDGRLDPRRAFPSLEVALNVLSAAVGYKNAERCESRIYGSWIPQAMHGEYLAANPRRQLDGTLEYLAARERRTLTVRRFGQVECDAPSPLGDECRYAFASGELTEWNGARVNVHFDPFLAPVLATISLAAPFRDTPAGRVIARDVAAVSTAPEVMQDRNGVWRIGFVDAAAAAQAAKRMAALVTRRELRVASLDGSRVAAESMVSAPDVCDRQVGVTAAAPSLNLDALRHSAREEVDLAALEAVEAAHKSA